MDGQQIRNRLHDGRRVYGTHVCSLTNPVTARLQAQLPYDFAFICNEHMPIDRTETSMMCQLFQSNGISPCVRISHPCAIEAAKALDGGAQGIVAPYVETLEQVRELVGAVKYRPVKGARLEQYLSGERDVPSNVSEFFDRFNKHNYLIIGIESWSAYENLEALITTPGVDGVFVGPHDLSVSMELPEQYDHPDFLAAIHDIIRQCRAAHVGIGVHFGQTIKTDEDFIDLISKGMNWVLYGADIALITAGMTKSLTRFREHFGDIWEAGSADGEVESCVTAGE